MIHLRSEHRSQYDRLLDRAFRLVPPENYLSDFPVWDPVLPHPENRVQIGIKEGDRLVASASLREVSYRFEDGSNVRLGLIGAVASDPDFEGRGLASGLIDQLLTEGRKRHLEDFVLWGSGRSLYSKRGFQFGGIQLRTPLDRIGVEGNIPEGYEVRTGWDEAIVALLRGRRSGVEYREVDTVWLSRHRGVEWRTLWFEGGCLGFIAWNRGIDLPGIIHEIEGTAEGKRALLLFVKRRYPDLELLHHPMHTEFGLKAITATERLAQFLCDRKDSPILKNIDRIWFSGMDSC